MAYKDEYEVARLYTQSGFLHRVAERFEGPYRLHFHLAPPILGQRDPKTGHLKKREFGPWVLPLFRLLATMKRLRGTSFDIFGKTPERRTERRLIGEYEALVEELLARLAPGNHALATELAALPMEIRGIGHVKEESIAHVKAREASAHARWPGVPPHHQAAD